MRMGPWTTIVGLALALGATACGVSPQTIPPPAVELAKLAIVDAGSGQVTVSGANGAVTDGDRIEVVSLGATPQLIIAAVSEDGSFSVTLAGLPADVYRLQATLDGQRSPPLDVIADTGVVREPDRIACLRVDPGPEIDLAGPVGERRNQLVTFYNDCAQPITLDETTLVLGTAGWFLEPSGLPPATIDPGASLGLLVADNIQAPEESREYARFVLSLGATSDVRVFTLRARGG